MKKTLILAAMAALMVTSCAKDENVKTNEQEVKFVIDGPVTRVTTNNNVTSFEVGDEIKITSEGLFEDISNEVYTLSDGGLEGQVVKFKKDGTTGTFVAHYPTSVDNTDGTVSYTVPGMQNAENFHSSMFMTATAEGNSENSIVNLQFRHCLAWVKVVLNNIEGANVSVCNVAPTAKFNAGTVTAEGEPTEIYTWKQTDKQEYWVLVPAQTVAADKRFITVTTTEGKTYEYTLANALEISTAKVKTVTLTLKVEAGEEYIEGSFSVDGMDDAIWEEEDMPLEGDLNEAVEPAVELISAEAGNFANVTLNANQTGKDKLVAGWGTVIANSQDKEGEVVIATYPNATIVVENDAATITGAGKGTGAWYNKNLAYLATNAKPGTYEITMSYKVETVSETADDNQLQIMLMQGGITTNVYYQFCSSNYSYPVCTAEYTTKSFTAVIPADANLSGGVIFMVTPKKVNSQKFYIKDVTIIEVK